MTHIEAMKQDGDCQRCGGKGCIACDAREQEPVAHCTVRPLRGDEAYPKTEILWVKGRPIAGPLYTLPPKREWVGLTPEELSAIWDRMGTWNSTSAQHFYNAIWKALKGKNNRGGQTD